MNSSLEITVGARSSPLSQIQVKEVLDELHQHHPHIQFQPVFLKTKGDHDQKTSLRDLDKTDFFTKELDQMLLKGQVRICVHSAKDLPDPIPKGLEWICLTKGVDSRDALVLRPGQTLSSLLPHAVIATSSVRREEVVRSMRSDLTFSDLRGTIGMRLEKLNEGIDGVVIAEAALIRLKLTHLNRIYLEGETTAYQGQLAILARKDDEEMIELFSPLDVRKKDNEHLVPRP